MHSDLTYNVTKSYLKFVCDKKIRNGYITLETRDKILDWSKLK